MTSRSHGCDTIDVILLGSFMLNCSELKLRCHSLSPNLVITLRRYEVLTVEVTCCGCCWYKCPSVCVCGQVNEMELTRSVAERVLREHKGNVFEALVTLTNWKYQTYLRRTLGGVAVCGNDTEPRE